MSSPFSEGAGRRRPVGIGGGLRRLAAELEDEEFGEAMRALVDEAAGRHLAAVGGCPSGATEQLADGEVEEWMAGIASEADRLLEHVERHFAARIPESLAEGEVDALLTEAFAAQGRPGLGRHLMAMNQGTSS